MKPPITECQGLNEWPSSYVFVRREPVGEYIFKEPDGPEEVFARRKSVSGWHLRRGAYCYEFCRENRG
jgi:hypothetical protein